MIRHTWDVADSRGKTGCKYEGFETKASLLSDRPGAWQSIQPLSAMTDKQRVAALAAASRRLAKSEEMDYTLPFVVPRMLAARRGLPPGAYVEHSVRGVSAYVAAIHEAEGWQDNA